MGCGFAEFNAEIITHFLCKRPACGAGKNSYDTVEANKKYLLATIEKNGMNIEKIVKSVNFDVKNMQSVITSLFNQTINAIKSIKVSSNSYSDNRNISIRGDSRDILNALQNRVGLAVSYGNYN